MRAWKKRNPDKVKRMQERYWTRRAAREAAAAEADGQAAGAGRTE